MSIITGLRSRLFGEEADEPTSRFNCNACKTKFTESDLASDVVCPECGEGQRIFRV